jgi:hypothetical protein
MHRAGSLIGLVRSRRVLVLLAVVLVLLAVALVASAAAAGSASAGDVLHLKATSPLIAQDYPAGTVCDFAYHEEYVNTSNVKVFFDEAGNPVRVEEQVELSVLHRNLETGFTVTEVTHYAFHFDLVAGEVTLTGNWWHLRDAENRIVVVGSGMYVRDLFTGELLRATPNVGADFAEVNCTLLGGAPAS